MNIPGYDAWKMATPDDKPGPELPVPIGTKVLITRTIFAGSVGYIYGKNIFKAGCYAIIAWKALRDGYPLTWADGSPRSIDINLPADQFEIVA